MKSSEMQQQVRVDPLPMRDRVWQMEAEMRKMEQVTLPLTHHFGYRSYARELFIPKGTLLTGRIHLYPQINIMPKGDLSVLVDDGVVRVQAPFTVVSPAGTKRIAYAHEDTIWITIIGTEETDPALIEQSYTVETEAAYQAFLEGVAKVKEIEPCRS
jgi:hypothetical protein